MASFHGYNISSRLFILIFWLASKAKFFSLRLVIVLYPANIITNSIFLGSYIPPQYKVWEKKAVRRNRDCRVNFLFVWLRYSLSTDFRIRIKHVSPSQSTSVQEVFYSIFPFLRFFLDEKPFEQFLRFEEEKMVWTWTSLKIV